MTKIFTASARMFQKAAEPARDENRKRMQATTRAEIEKLFARELARPQIARMGF